MAYRLLCIAYTRGVKKSVGWGVKADVQMSGEARDNKGTARRVLVKRTLIGLTSKSDARVCCKHLGRQNDPATSTRQRTASSGCYGLGWLGNRMGIVRV